MNNFPIYDRYYTEKTSIEVTGNLTKQEIARMQQIVSKLGEERKWTGGISKKIILNADILHSHLREEGDLQLQCKALNVLLDQQLMQSPRPPFRASKTLSTKAQSTAAKAKLIYLAKAFLIASVVVALSVVTFGVAAAVIGAVSSALFISALTVSSAATVVLGGSAVYANYSAFFSEMELRNATKLFAHVHGDPFISETALEGYSKEQAMKFLAGELHAKIKALQAQEIRDAGKIAAYTQLLASIERGLSLASPSLAASIENTLLLSGIRLPTGLGEKRYQESMQKAISQLRKGESVLIPGGWSGKPAGHAMYFKYTRQEDGRFHVKIYNSGSGIDHHESVDLIATGGSDRSPRLQTLHRPCLELENVSEANLTNPAHLKVLFELQYRFILPGGNNAKFNAEDVYRSFLPFLQGTPVESSSRQMIVAQHSGTCAWAGLMAVAQDHLPPEEFAQFELDLQYDSLAAFSEMYADIDVLKDNEEARNLLRRSSEQLAISARAKFGHEVISLARLNQVNQLVERVQKQVERAKVLHDSARSASVARATFAAVHQPAHSTYPSNLGSTSLRAAGPVINVERPAALVWDPNWTPAAATIDTQLKDFHDKYSAEVRSSPYLVLTCLHQLFTRLPMPKKAGDSFWSTLSPAQQEVCMQQLINLSELMTTAAGLLDLDRLPEAGHQISACLFKGYAIQHRLALENKELQEMGINTWNLTRCDQFIDCYLGYSRSGESGRGTPIYDDELLRQMVDIRDYFWQQQTPSPPFFGDSSLHIADSSDGPPTEGRVIYNYYLNNGKTLNPLLNQDPEAQANLKNCPSTDPNVANATYLMRDLTGKYLPKAFCRMKRQLYLSCFFMAGHILNLHPNPDRQALANGKPLWRTQTDTPLFYFNFDQMQKRNGFPKAPCADNSWCWVRSEENAKSLTAVLFDNRPMSDALGERIPSIENLSPNEVLELQSICAYTNPENGIIPFEIQIIKTLDYFKRSIHRLNDVEFQQLFQRLIFTKDYLRQALQQSPEVAQLFQNMIQTAYKYFKERRNIQAASFCVYMSQMFEERIKGDPAFAKMSSESRNAEQLTELLAQSRTTEEKSIIYRQLLFQASTMNEKEIRANLEKILEANSFLVINPLPSKFKNTHLEGIVERFRNRILPILRHEPPDRIGKAVAELIAKLNPGLAKTLAQASVQWTKSGPEIIAAIGTTTLCTFNIQSYSIQYNEGQLAQLPVEITSSSAFGRAFPNKIYSAVKKGEVYEFEENGLKVRIKKTADGIVIQRQFERDGMFFENRSPARFTQQIQSKILREERTYWVSCADHRTVYLCNLHSHNVTHKLIPSRSGFRIYDATQELHLLRLSNSVPAAYRLFERFAGSSKEFPFENVHIWVDEQGVPKKAELPQYGLNFTFETDPSTGQWRARCIEETGFTLASEQTLATMEDFHEYLVLQKTNRDGSVIRKVLVPRLPIAVSKNYTSQITLNRDHPPVRGALPPYYSYTVNTHGELVGSHEGGNLYRAYQLLGQRRFSEAQNYLRISSRRLKRYDERDVEIFNWLSGFISAEGPGDPRKSAVILSSIALHWRSNQIHGRGDTSLQASQLDQQMRMRKIYNEYTNYLSMPQHLADLLLTTEEELALLKEFKKFFADDNAIQEFVTRRLALLSGTPAEALAVVPPRVSRPAQPSLDRIDRRALEACFQEILEERDPSQRSTASRLITRPDIPPIIPAEEYEKTRSCSEGERKKVSDEMRVRAAFASKPIDKAFFLFLSEVAKSPTSFPNSWEKLHKLGAEGVLKTLSSLVPPVFHEESVAGPVPVSAESDTKHRKVERDFVERKETKEFSAVSQVRGGVEPAITVATGKSQAEQKSMPLSGMVLPISARAELSAKEKSMKAEPLIVTPLGALSLPRVHSYADTVAKLFAQSQHEIKGGKELLASLQKESKFEKEMKDEGLEEHSKKLFIEDVEAFVKEPSPVVYTVLDSTSEGIDARIHFEALIPMTQEFEKLHLSSITMQERLLKLANRRTFENEGTLTAEQRAIKAKHLAELGGREMRPMTIDDLALLALSSNWEEIQRRNPMLSVTDVNALRTQIIEYLTQITEEQNLARQIQALEEIRMYVGEQGDISPSDPVLQELCSKAAEAMNSRRAYAISGDPKTYMKLLAYEYYTGKRLRTDQVDQIRSLTGFKVRQMIMGSGKSKVLLPILALAQADPEHLSTVVLPDALYETGVRDLRATMGEAFNRSVHTLAFDRDPSTFTLERLRDIHQYLSGIRSRSECVVMTSKSLLCLEATLTENSLELNEAIEKRGRLAPAQNEDVINELINKIETLNSILELFKTGRAIIDEVDTVCNRKKQLIYTVGGSEEILAGRRRIVCTLYQQFYTNPKIARDENFKKNLLECTLKAITSEKTPFGETLYRLFAEGHGDKLRAYLLEEEGTNAEEGEKLVATLRKSDSEASELLALLKLQLNKVMPLTLNKICHVHFGPSLKPASHNRSSGSLAKPYSANNTPEEESDFSNHYEHMNCTIQMHWECGIPRSEIGARVRWLQAQMERESKLKGIAEDQTTAYRIFNRLRGKDCADIDLESCQEPEIERLTDAVNQSRTTNPQRFFDFLQEFLLPRIPFQPIRIVVKQDKLISMFGSVVAFTGTLWNSDSFPEILRANTERALGTDGKTAALLVQNSTVSDLDTSSNDLMINQLLKLGPDAIIDTGHVFNGQDNEKVAREILRRLPATKKAVIFFRGNTPMVLSRGEEGRAPAITPLADIDDRTLRPEERFTYYDQPHTTGTDISQHATARAVATISNEITFRDVAQGVWRMRGLARQQNVALAYTPEAGAAIRTNNHLAAGASIGCLHVIHFLQNNEMAQKRDHLIAATPQKMAHVASQLVSSALRRLNLRDAATQKGYPEALRAANAFLVTIMRDSPYAICGTLDRSLKRDEMIAKWKKTIMDNFEIALVNPLLFPDPTTHPQILKDLSEEIDRVISATNRLLPKEMRSSSASTVESEEVNAEQEQEQEQEQESEKEVEEESYQRQLNSGFQNPIWQAGHPPPDIFSARSDFFKIPRHTFGKSIMRFSTFSPAEHAYHDTMNRLCRGLSITSNTRTITEGRLELPAKQLPTQYVLFRKIGSRVEMQLLNAQDFAFYWRALAADRKGEFPGDAAARDAELCLCNIDGDVVAYDRSLNDPKRRAEFEQAQLEQGTMLRTRAKLLHGEIYYTPEEERCLQSLIKECGGREMIINFLKIALKNSPSKMTVFPQTTLGKLLGSPELTVYQPVLS